MAKVKVQNEFAGKGCMVQLLALVVIFVGFALGPVGLIAGLVLGVGLFFYGSGLGQKWVCSECRNPLDSDKVRLCPTCKADLIR